MPTDDVGNPHHQDETRVDASNYTIITNAVPDVFTATDKANSRQINGMALTLTQEGTGQKHGFLSSGKTATNLMFMMMQLVASMGDTKMQAILEQHYDMKLGREYGVKGAAAKALYHIKSRLN